MQANSVEALALLSARFWSNGKLNAAALDEAAERMKQRASENPEILFGDTLDEFLNPTVSLGEEGNGK